MKNTKNIIEIKNLTKKFGSFTAVDKMNLTVREGEIFGFPRAKRRRQDDHYKHAYYIKSSRHQVLLQLQAMT